MHDVIGTTWPQRIVRWSAYLLSGAFFYGYVAYIDQSSTALKDYQLALLVALGVAIALLIFGFVLNFLWLIPWEIWKQNKIEIDDLNEKVRPRLAIDGIGPQVMKRLDHARSSTTWGGTRFYAIKEGAHGITLKVENPSSLSISGCKAHLVRFSKIGESAENWQSLTLPWEPIDDKIDAVEIPPQGNRNIWLMRVVANSPQFMTVYMPLEMQLTLEQKGEYEGLIVLTAEGVAASHFPFTLLCDGPENPPVLTLNKIGD